MRLFVAIAASLAASLGTVERADACSGSCIHGSFLPRDGATIPANASALYWRPSSDATPDGVRLTPNGGAPIPLIAIQEPNGWLLTPATPLVAGTQYVIEETDGCEQPFRVTFTAGPTAPFPTSLGTTQREGPYERSELLVETALGSCSIEADATHATIVLAHSADAEPWKDLFFYETIVDGRGWSPRTDLLRPHPIGESWRGRGRDQLFRVCGDTTEGRRLEEGHHEAAFRARLPGEPPLSASAETIEIECELPEPSNGCSTTRASTGVFMWLALLGLLRRRAR
jgi:hypothetical protein